MDADGGVTELREYSYAIFNDIGAMFGVQTGTDFLQTTKDGCTYAIAPSINGAFIDANERGEVLTGSSTHIGWIRNGHEVPVLDRDWETSRQCH